MAVFRYEAVDRAGKLVRGVMNAADEQAVARRLAAMGYVLKAIVPSTAATAQTARQRQASSGFPVTVQPVVPLQKLAMFYRQIATLIRAGVPVAQALDELSNNIKNKKLSNAALEMRNRVQQGATLSSSMAMMPKLFPVHATGMIWSGELGGFLDKALDEVATEIEQEAKDNRYASIGWLLFKITLVFIFLLLPSLDIKGLLIEGFRQGTELHYKSTEITSTELTELIPAGISTSDIVKGMAKAYWIKFCRTGLPCLIAWIVFAFAWKHLKRVASVRRALDAALLMVPVWGNLHRERSRARFLNTLYRLYAAGIAPAQAWAAASMSVRNSQLAAKLRANEHILRQQDGTLDKIFIASGVFAAEDAGMVMTGIKSGAVPEMLERMSSYHLNAAETSKSLGRQVSLHALLLPIIIGTGIFTIYIVYGWFEFAFEVPKLLGLEL